MSKLLAVFILTCGLMCGRHVYVPGDPVLVRQLVVVRSPDPASTSATLQRFAKRRKEWEPVGSSVPVTLGRSGLARGRGVYLSNTGPQKREGDGKSPAGVFTFGKIFGYAPASEVQFKMPYAHATETLECVDDSGSQFYNQLIYNDSVQKDWSSSEYMRRTDHQYRWGIVVEHNTPAEAQGGSCIFLHIWKEPGAPTSGCTAMSEADLLELLHWLDPQQSPMLLQVTEHDYPSLRQFFELPK